jgi:hypothetical protein
MFHMPAPHLDSPDVVHSAVCGSRATVSMTAALTREALTLS